MHQGSCLCQAVRYEIDGTFEAFFLCHCSRCRKTSGSAHASNLFSAQGKLSFLSGDGAISRFRLEGTRFARTFCRICSGTLPTLQDNGSLLVPAGSLDTAVSLRPRAHIFCESRADWDHGLDALQTFDRFPE